MVHPPRISGSKADLNKLRTIFSDPVAIPNLVSKQQQQYLLDFFWSVYQPHGAGHDFLLWDEKNKPLLEVIKAIGKDLMDDDHFYSIASFVRLIHKPGPHVDSQLINNPGFSNDKDTILDNVAGKVMFLQLAVDDDANKTDIELSELVTIYTNQRWFGKGTNFLKGEPGPRNWVSKHRAGIYDYRGLVDSTDEPFDPQVFDKYLKNMVNYSSLQGMSSAHVFPWKLRQGVISDMSNIHMASDHETAGFKSKIFLNIKMPYRNPQNLL